MRKFLAVVKHEYKKIVLKWSFIIGTLLFPIIAAGFAVVPAIIFSIKGEPTRIAIVDQSGKIAERLKENLSAERMTAKAEQAIKDSLKNIDAPADERMKNSAEQFVESFVFTDYAAGEKPLEQIRHELGEKITVKELDAYLIIPENLDAADAKYEFRSRKAGDFGGERSLRDALNEAVRSERLAGANISEAQLKDLSRNVDFDAKSLDEKGEEKDSDSIFIASFIIGLMIYLTLAIYGQQILAAVVEEKETRIAEILFSSARPFELMMGKLTGVGLAGLTQLANLDIFSTRFSRRRRGAVERGGNGHSRFRYLAADGHFVFRLFSSRDFSSTLRFSR
jgi:ABC-2 type transport system permease protein